MLLAFHSARFLLLLLRRASLRSLSDVKSLVTRHREGKLSLLLFGAFNREKRREKKERERGGGRGKERNRNVRMHQPTEEIKHFGR